MCQSGVEREQNRFVYDLSRVNEARSPLYHRLDLRADYRFNFEDWSLVTFVEAENVYDRANVFQYVWNPRRAAATLRARSPSCRSAA